MVLIVLSCSINGTSENDEIVLEGESRSSVPWILCPNRTCSNHNMGLQQTHTYKLIKEEHRGGACDNCDRRYYHKKEYTEHKTKHQCVMSGGCGYTTYTTRHLNKKCITDPNEGKYIGSKEVPKCNNKECPKYGQTMFVDNGPAPSFMRYWDTYGLCSDYCGYRYKHKTVQNHVNVRKYECNGYLYTVQNFIYNCDRTGYTCDYQHVVCYK